VPVLLFNKMDRLIVELKMKPYEAYKLLIKYLEQANAFCSLFRQKDSETNSTSTCVGATGPEEDESSHPFFFDPRKGNVLFGSAIDGWAFR
jgi:ribosome assembly protein 1